MPERDREKIMRRSWANREKLRQYIYDYSSSHPCVDCGEADPVVLTYDHVRGEKKFNISKAVKLNVSLDTLIAEIAKCDVRCANDHFRRTAKVSGWYAGLQDVE